MNLLKWLWGRGPQTQSKIRQSTPSPASAPPSSASTSTDDEREGQERIAEQKRIVADDGRRFEIVSNGPIVIDRSTGLMWRPLHSDEEGSDGYYVYRSGLKPEEIRDSWCRTANDRAC